MKTEFLQKIEFFLTLLQDRLQGEHPAHIEALLKEMHVLAFKIGGSVLEHFQDLEREARRYLKEPRHLPALKERVLKLKNDLFQL